MMESLQLAQMLADLSDLNAAEPKAAAAIVAANKAIDKAIDTTISQTAGSGSSSAGAGDSTRLMPEPRHHQRVASASAGVSRTASPARFDNIGRRILTPPITRSNSTQGSIPGTPKKEYDNEGDVDRASTLLALYEIRAKLKQQDNSSLAKAREKIAALAAKQQAMARKQSAPSWHSQTPFPKKS